MTRKKAHPDSVVGYAKENLARATLRRVCTVGSVVVEDGPTVLVDVCAMLLALAFLLCPPAWPVVAWLNRNRHRRGLKRDGKDWREYEIDKEWWKQ